MKADAVVFTDRNTVEYCRVDCPEPADDDVVVRVKYSWISNGTEGSYLRGERINGDTPRRPDDPWPFPIVPGYQKVGIAEWVGSKVQDIQVGQEVFASVGKVEGMFFPVGGHINPSITPCQQVWKLPSSPESLAYSGMLLTQVGYNCGSRASVLPGQTAVVLGDGPVGQWALQTLALQKAKLVMAGMDNDRLKLAEKLTGCQTVNISGDKWLGLLKEMARDGIAVAVDTAGSRRTLETILPFMQHRGHIVSAGFCGTDDRISMQALRDFELSIDSVSGSNRRRMDETLALIEKGALQTLPLITHHFAVQDAAKAWELIASRKQHILGVILDW